MSRLAELLKSQSPPANVANPANLQATQGKHSQLSQDSQRGKANLQLPADLERRIKTMAVRWRYTSDELAEVLVLAAADPHGWQLAVALDERREAEFRAAGLLAGDA